MIKKANIVKLFHEYKPKTAKEARNIGLSLIRLGSGAFREVYAVNKHDVDNRLVVKFPLDKTRYGTEGDLEHAQHEIYMIRKINNTQKFCALRPFMPKMWYSDFRHGVLLTDFYYKVRDTKGCIAGQVLSQVADAIFFEEDRLEDRDIENYNIMQTKEGELKIIDLGLV